MDTFFNAYICFQNLKERLSYVLSNFGEKYDIIFYTLLIISKQQSYWIQKKHHDLIYFIIKMCLMQKHYICDIHVKRYSIAGRFRAMQKTDLVNQTQALW